MSRRLPIDAACDSVCARSFLRRLQRQPGVLAELCDQGLFVKGLEEVIGDARSDALLNRAPCSVAADDDDWWFESSGAEVASNINAALVAS